MAAGESDGTTDGAPTDEAVVETAAAAAQDAVFSTLSRSDVTDFDVTVSFVEGVLTVDVYLDAPGVDEERLETVADDAALTAQSAVDDLFGE